MIFRRLNCMQMLTGFLLLAANAGVVAGGPVRPEPLPADVVAAWLKAGALAGWMAPGEFGQPVFRVGGDGKEGEIPLHLHSTNPGLTNAGLKSLAKLKSLRSLDFSCLYVTDDGLKELAGLESLETLRIYHMMVSDFGVKELARLKSLRSLDLGLAQVSDVAMRELGGLKALQHLDLTGAQITDAGLRELAGMKSLRSLVLTGTAAQAQPKEAEQKLPDLRFLVTESGVAELRKALPFCSIQH